MDWNHNRVVFYVDGVPYQQWTNTGDPSTWPFDDAMNIILNNAVGGDWGGAQGVDDNIFPTKYTIDYVRQYAPNP